MISSTPPSRINGDLGVGHPIVRLDPVADAEHFSKGARRVYLRCIHGELAFFRLAARLKSDSEKALIEIDVDPGLISPNGISRVIGVVGLADNAEHAAKTIDHEVVGVV